jgi:uncharacterized protein (DUF2062 family)
MGIVPIWGFQLIVAITLSFLLKLNKALVVIAANISIPPMIPVIIFLSHGAGALWMGDKAQRISFDAEITLELIQNSFVQYVYGAITLAVVVGTVMGGLTYLFLKFSTRK